MKVEEKERERMKKREKEKDEVKKERRKRINLLFAFIMNKSRDFNFSDWNRLKENSVRTNMTFQPILSHTY